MLVPRKSDVGTLDLSGRATKKSKSPEHKYNLALEHLLRATPGTAKAANDIDGAKESLIKNGVADSTLDIYLKKQRKWAEARNALDAARNDAIGM
jgi:hypothetical protein